VKVSGGRRRRVRRVRRVDDMLMLEVFYSCFCFVFSSLVFEGKEI